MLFRCGALVSQAGAGLKWALIAAVLLGPLEMANSARPAAAVLVATVAPIAQPPLTIAEASVAYS